MLMTLAVSLAMSEEERRIVTRELIKGFNDAATTAGTMVTGGQTVMNPWPIIGGIAMTVATEDQFIRPTGAEEGDVIVLTKPLGTQLAVNLFEWFHDKPQVFSKLNGLIPPEDVHRIYNEACVHMSALNRTAGKLMLKYHAKGATDVTGFGILGHAMNLASVQTRNVSFRINRMPVIRGVMAADKVVYNFKLREGYSAETSGGLMVVLSRDQAPGFMEEFATLEGHPCWLIGEVLAGDKVAYIDPNADILEV
jgi:selenide,water dikinase